jgi:hypothetical protein
LRQNQGAIDAVSGFTNPEKIIGPHLIRKHRRVFNLINRDIQDFGYLVDDVTHLQPMCLHDDTTGFICVIHRLHLELGAQLKQGLLCPAG